MNGQRSWRYAAIVDDGTVTAWFEEPGINDDGADEDPYFESSPRKVVEWLKASNEGAGDPHSRTSDGIGWLQRTSEESFA